jgi:hypothetical protein
MRRRALALAALAIAVAPAAAGAADPVPSLDLRGFRAPQDHASGLYLEPAATPSSWDWNTALWIHYARGPITLRGADDELAFRVIDDQLTGDFTATVGFAERFALGLGVPFVIAQGGDEPDADSARVLGETALPAQALGDLGLYGKATLIRPTSGEFGGLALALDERFTLPTGDDASFLGEGHVASETRLLAEYRLVALSVHLALGAKLRAEPESFACERIPDDACPTRFGHELPFGLGVAFRPQAIGLDDKGRWTWFVETHGYLPLSPVGPFDDSRLAEAQLGAAARYTIRDVSLLGGLETAMLGGVGNAPIRASLSVGWAPRVHDVDGDGIEDDVDQCRELAEDLDGFQDADGCPEGDNDDDGVPDVDDKCPETPEDEDRYQDDDGCPDLDNDADGIVDAADACLNEPGATDPDPKKSGCPDRDPDGDGVSGAADACPTVAEDRDGFQDDDGCPDPDNDGDGFADADDACPNVPGVASSIAKERGCPDPDPDKDTLTGADDKCPDKAETWDGVDDADGCPDDGAKKKGKPLAITKDTKDGPVVQLAAALKWSGVELDPATLPLVRALAAELLAHPTYSVAVGVRPTPKGGANEALLRSFAVVDALRRFTRRDEVAETVAWAAVKAQPRAAEHGVGFLVLVPQPAPADAKAPAATPPAKP